MLKRFAIFATGAVALVIVCGSVMTWLQTDGDLATLFTTPYGRRLAFKISAVGLLLAIAATNRWRLGPRLQRGERRAATLLAGLLAADVAIAALVVAATARLNIDPPPRVIHMHSGHSMSPLSAGLETELAPAGRLAKAAGKPDVVHVAFAPSSTDRTSVVLDYTDADGRSLQVADAVLNLSLPDRNVEGMRWHARPDASGRLRAENVVIPFAGRWVMNVEVFVDDFTRHVFKGEVLFEAGGGMAGMPGMSGADANAVSTGITRVRGENLSAADAASDAMAGMSGMASDLNGATMNGNADRLPIDCATLSGDRSIIVHAGTRYAAPGMGFGYDHNEWDVPACTRVTMTIVNEDGVRHQLMMHGLPRYLYPQGMLHVEADGGASRSITFIVPSRPKTYLVHCDMAQHTEKGLKAELKAAGGSGDLPGIPGISPAGNAGLVKSRWSGWQLATLALGVDLAAALLLFAYVPASFRSLVASCRRSVKRAVAGVGMVIAWARKRSHSSRARHQHAAEMIHRSAAGAADHLSYVANPVLDK